MEFVSNKLKLNSSPQFLIETVATASDPERDTSMD